MDRLKDLPIRQVAKGTVLLYRGGICDQAYKVIKGCLRSYVADSSGKEHILHFAPEGWLLSDLNSLFNNVPAIVSIDAIEDSEVMVFERKMMPVFEKMDNDELQKQVLALRRNVIAANKRLIMLLSATSKERYLDFMETYPDLMQRLPLKLIASYIGVTPEYLSDIRKGMSKK